MNAVVDFYRDEMDFEVDSAIDRRRERTIPHRSRRPENRRNPAPASVNGIHRRRNKRWTWGSGRGAKMLCLRAMASGLALALASLSGAALGSGVTIDYATVGDPGNPGLVTSQVQVNTSAPVTQSGTWGAVSYVFKIAKYETSNSDYVKFLNSVDPNGTNPFGIYNAQMSSNSNGGIDQDLGAGTGNKYSVKTGFDTKPVIYVSWFSAARFANWLNNGQPSGTAGTESGAYTLSGTSGAAVARNSGAQVYLPSLDEFIKAAFYDPTLNGGPDNYFAYGTRSDTAPQPIPVGSGVNMANYGGNDDPSFTTGPVDGTAFPNTQSYYGLFNAFGNVAEWSDTAGTGSLVNVNGSGWKTTNAQAANWTSDRVRYFGTGATDSFGFRVAAVPEPGSVILAAIGVGGVFGGEYVRRRRRSKVC